MEQQGLLGLLGNINLEQFYKSESASSKSILAESRQKRWSIFCYNQRLDIRINCKL